ncbi:MAG TPA: adenylate/guanylate cyclase domain-containing protein [Candidatus Tectomicrobia bacterium]
MAPLDAQIHGALGPISVHIGINSSLALGGPTKLQGATGTRWTYTASGSVTNIAARLATLGEGGMVLVGPETAQRIAGRFHMQEIGQRQLKTSLRGCRFIASWEKWIVTRNACGVGAKRALIMASATSRDDVPGGSTYAPEALGI